MNYSHLFGNGAAAGSGANPLGSANASLVNQYPEDAYPSRTTLARLIGDKTTIASVARPGASGALIDDSNQAGAAGAAIRDQSAAVVVGKLMSGQTLVGKLNSAALSLLSSAVAAASQAGEQGNLYAGDDNTTAATTGSSASDDFYLDEQRIPALATTTSSITTIAPLNYLANAANSPALSTSSPLTQLATQSSSSSSSSSFSDWWNEYWSRQPFPSGYTQSSITLLACLITTIIFLIVVGNLLVCIAIFTEKSLKPTQNWFIASLAVSDMLLGLVVMPFSLARELMGFWVFGPLWCDIHEAVDVLLTTASINTLCLISLDRYWSITQAVSYLKKRTPRRGAFMIAFVWVFSAAVSLPPLFGWKKQSPNVTGPAPPPPPPTPQPPSSTTIQHTIVENDKRTLAGNRTRDEQRKQQFDMTGSAGDQTAGLEGPGDGSLDESVPPSTGMDNSESATSGEAAQHWRRKRRRPGRSRRRAPLGASSPFQAGQDELAERRGELAHLVPFGSTVHKQQEQAYFASMLMQQQQQLTPSEGPMGAGQVAPAVNEYPTCQLSDDIGYVLYSALGSFYIPCAVMVFTYIKIFLAARSRARRTINKQSRAAGQTGASEKAKQRASAKEAAAAAAAAAAAGAATANNRKAISGTASGPRSTGKPLSKCARARISRDDDDDEEESLTATVDMANKCAEQLDMAGKLSRKHQHQQAVARRQSGPMAAGSKLVVLERRKSAMIAQQVAVAGVAVQQQLALAAEAGEVQRAEPETCATLTTSGAKQATSSVLTGSNAGAECSALITVMSESMSELPITRFNFKHDKADQPQEADKQKQQQHDCKITEKSESTAEAGRDNRSVAALLEAINQARDYAANETLIREISEEEAGERRASRTQDDLAAGDSGDTVGQRHEDNATNKVKLRQAQPQQNNVTNETCFMTIEEDSDSVEAQTGRTILMLAASARSGRAAPKCPLGCQQQAGSNSAGAAGAPLALVDGSPVICNNVACLRRHQRQRQRAAARAGHGGGSSYCSSSMTINDDDEDEEDDEEEVDDEEEEDDEEDDDGCLDDDLLTDECNGSCGLEQFCPAGSNCVHCRECAAYQAKAGSGPNAAADTCQDSPDATTDACQLSTPGESPARIFAANSNRKYTHHHHRQQQHQLQQQQQHPHLHHDHCSVLMNNNSNNEQNETQSLTSEDNLSLTDYRSNEEGEDEDDEDEDEDEEDANSSILGHDMLDASPAIERPQSAAAASGDSDKGRSIGASALASAAGGAVGGGYPAPGADESLGKHNNKSAARKKSSIGFRLARLGSSAPAAPASLSNQTGRLLALAAASQQQQQQQQVGGGVPGSGGTTRNLKTLRQNFFHKLNQLTAKSAAAKQNAKFSSKSRSPNDKSSAQSSYGSSYEPSIDYATTSNVHSNNDNYPQETTFGETDDFDQQTGSGADTKLSSGDRGDVQCLTEDIDPATGKLIASQLDTGASESKQLPDDMSKVKPAALVNHSNQVAVSHHYHHQSHQNRHAQPKPLHHSQNHHQYHSQRDGTADSLATSKQLISTTTTTDEDSMLIPHSTTSNGNKSQNNLDLGANKANNKNNRNGSGAVAIINSSTSVVINKKRSADRGLGNQFGVGPTGGLDKTIGPTSGGNGTSRSGGTASTNRAYLASDNERHKRKLAKARERRATLILGLIMAAFICSWLPFFTFYVLRALCHVCRDYISPRFEAFIFWMGYCNSAINPIIYTIFNRDFRKAFRKILFKCL